MLAFALERAAVAGEWDAVKAIVDELRSRRLASTGVVELRPSHVALEKDRGGQRGE